MKRLSQARNDVVGGLVSAAVAIPLAMGYGMFAFSSLGENYFADGALAGLATALAVGITCVLLRDKTTTVYAPRVNSTFFLGILIYGLVHSHAPAITAGGVPFILAVAFWIILLGGVLTWPIDPAAMACRGHQESFIVRDASGQALGYFVEVLNFHTGPLDMNGRTPRPDTCQHPTTRANRNRADHRTDTARGARGRDIA